jgi:outer membrane receptor protein involved in Fe transport
MLLLISTFTYAQKGTIRGTVFEGSTGETLVGVSVIVEGTYTGASTDLDGKFSIDVDPGTYGLQISFISFQPITISDVVVTPGEVTLLNNIELNESTIQLQDVVVSARALRNTEAALQTIKRNSSAMLDGISAAKISLIGDGTAVEAAKRVTGVTIEGGKYIYVRGLGDRYSKTTLNSVDIPGLDPDRNSLQMDIFPTNLIENMMVSKNFTADMPADFTGGLMNVETKDFPEEKMMTLSLSTSYNPDMHFNKDYLTYDGGKLDFLGMDDGTRELPTAARGNNLPLPYSGYSDDEVANFVKSFNPQLGAQRKNSLMDYSASLSLGDQLNVGSRGDGKLGYIFSLSYKTEYKYYDDLEYGAYQKYDDPDLYEMRYATIRNGQMGEQNVLIGLLGGLAYKNNYNKVRLTAMRLQNGESRAAQFNIKNDGAAVGQSGYIAESDNLEYNQRSLTNLLLNGKHTLQDSGWEIDWRLSPTFSTSDDPDIRKTAFTEQPGGRKVFSAGAGGNPSRRWRELTEINATTKVDISKDYQFKDRKAQLKFGASHNYKKRDYEILTFDMQFASTQSWPDADISTILDPINLFPNRPNGIYYQSGNPDPNPNEYSSNANNSGFYVSNELYPFARMKTIIGLRAENFVQHHTGRDQAGASGQTNGNILDNSEVLNSLDLFPTLNLIYELTENQNIRAAFAKTIARPSFKELSYAQILDPISNTTFNGGFHVYEPDWDGNLTETYINNYDLRWELFMEQGQNVSASVFYKQFDDPIEIVRIPTATTSTEIQPRNVGDAHLYGFEFEFNQNLKMLSPIMKNLNINGNITLVKSELEMTSTEYNSRKPKERTGENIQNTREMAGQSPYVVNAGLVYNNADSGIDAGLFYNVKGPTLLIVGTGIFPDVYQEPLHSLNLSLNKKFGEAKKTSVDFKVSNILNQDELSYYESYKAANQTNERRSPGRSFSIGLSHKF